MKLIVRTAPEVGGDGSIGGTAEVIGGTPVVTGPMMADILDARLVDPERPGRWATPADGVGWLRAVALRFYRPGYYTVEWINGDGEPCDGPWQVQPVMDWYANLMGRIDAGGDVTGEDVAALLRLCGAYRPANPAHRLRDASDVPAPPPGSVIYSVDAGGWYAKFPDASVYRDRDTLPPHPILVQTPNGGPAEPARLADGTYDFGPLQRIAARRGRGKRSRLHPHVIARALAVYALWVTGRTHRDALWTWADRTAALIPADVAEARERRAGRGARRLAEDDPERAQAEADREIVGEYEHDIRQDDRRVWDALGLPKMGRRP